MEYSKLSEDEKKKRLFAKRVLDIETISEGIGVEIQTVRSVNRERTNKLIDNFKRERQPHKEGRQGRRRAQRREKHDEVTRYTAETIVYEAAGTRRRPC